MIKSKILNMLVPILYIYLTRNIYSFILQVVVQELFGSWTINQSTITQKFHIYVIEPLSNIEKQ